MYIKLSLVIFSLLSKPSQWNHVPTDCNLADLATREFHASDLPCTMWIHGPTFLHQDQACEGGVENKLEGFPLVDAEEDREVKKENITCRKTTLKPSFEWEKFSRFFTWKNLLRAVVNIKSLARKHKKLPRNISVPEAETVIIKGVQSTSFSDEI